MIFLELPLQILIGGLKKRRGRRLAVCQRGAINLGPSVWWLSPYAIPEIKTGRLHPRLSRFEVQNHQGLAVGPVVMLAVAPEPIGR